ncbi:MAG TPA: hypothetical protein VKU19_30215 [Bryobacteraceae bacterium]|nr:hypothetical protein [Bryobacteraceae bacterium]
MSRLRHWMGPVVAGAAFAVLVNAQLISPPSPANRANQFSNRFPAEIVLDRFIDVAKVAPRSFTVQQENTEVRVLHAKLDGSAKIPLHDARSGVMVALGDVNLRLTNPGGPSREIRLHGGETQWIDADTYTGLNLSSSPCEFLYIEMIRPR